MNEYVSFPEAEVVWKQCASVLKEVTLALNLEGKWDFIAGKNDGTAPVFFHSFKNCDISIQEDCIYVYICGIKTDHIVWASSLTNFSIGTFIDKLNLVKN